MAKTKAKLKTKPNVRGAKCKYDSDVKPRLLEIEAWCRDGYTDEMMYTKLGISKDSFYKYKREYPEFVDVLKRGKEVIDTMVENALLKRALGYTYDEVTKERHVDPETKEIILVESKKVTKEVQPDTTAQIYWLNNRKPKEWRNKQEVINNNINTEVPYETFLNEIIKDKPTS